MATKFLAYVLAICTIGCGANVYNCPSMANTKNVPYAHRHSMLQCAQETAYVPPSPPRAEPIPLPPEVRPTLEETIEEWDSCFQACVQIECADWYPSCGMPCHKVCGDIPE